MPQPNPELLTLKAVRMLAAADAVVHDRLVSPEILAMAPAGARMFPVGKAPRNHPTPQPAINALLIRLASEGLSVARLKGGDPFIFGRGSEEMLELRAAGVPVEVAPGITAAQGCAAAGVPLTHRGLATGVRLVTGHCRADLPLELDWSGLADPETTLVVYMGAASIDGIAAKLVQAGLDPATPALVVAEGTTPRERRVLSRLDRVAADLASAALSGPVLVLIGRVAAFAAGLSPPISRLCAGARKAPRRCMRDPRLLARFIAGLVALLPAVANASAIAAERLAPQREAALERLILQDCGSCHGMTLKGGLGTDLTADALAGRDPAEVARIVLDGVPGTAMPPWRPLLSEEEAAWIAEYLLEGRAE